VSDPSQLLLLDDECLNTNTISGLKNGNVKNSVRPRQAKDTLETADTERLEAEDTRAVGCPGFTSIQQSRKAYYSAMA